MHTSDPFELLLLHLLGACHRVSENEPFLKCRTAIFYLIAMLHCN